jgi:hypothetical protein
MDYIDLSINRIKQINVLDWLLEKITGTELYKPHQKQHLQAI